MSELQCSTCLKKFKGTFYLKRHLNRKNPCKEPIKTRKNINNELQEKVNVLEEKVNIEESKVNTLEKKVELLEVQQNDICIECSYCERKFNFVSNLTKHLKVCKSKVDNIEIYEKELQLTIEPVEELTCRFCNQQYSNSTSLSRHKTRGCREKIKYEYELEKQVLQNRRDAVGNVTNNNTTNNNIIINLPPMNSFDDTMKNIDYMTTKLLLKELEKHRSLNKNDLTGIIDTYTKLMHANPAHPENQNVLFKSLNSGFARVYNGREFEDRQSIEVQDTIVQNVGQKIGEVCSEYDNEQGEISDILDQIDVNFGNKLAEIKEGNYTRGLSQCRNTVKAALHSKKDEIELAHQLIENHQE